MTRIITVFFLSFSYLTWVFKQGSVDHPHAMALINSNPVNGVEVPFSDLVDFEIRVRNERDVVRVLGIHGNVVEGRRDARAPSRDGDEEFVAVTVCSHRCIVFCKKTELKGNTRMFQIVQTLM